VISVRQYFCRSVVPTKARVQLSTEAFGLPPFSTTVPAFRVHFTSVVMLFLKPACSAP